MESSLLQLQVIFPFPGAVYVSQGNIQYFFSQIHKDEITK